MFVELRQPVVDVQPARLVWRTPGETQPDACLVFAFCRDVNLFGTGFLGSPR